MSEITCTHPAHTMTANQRRAEGFITLTVVLMAVAVSVGIAYLTDLSDAVRILSSVGAMVVSYFIAAPVIRRLTRANR